MGLKETLEDAALSAIAAFGNVNKEIEYYSVTEGVYNPATDSKNDTNTRLDFVAPMVRQKEETADWKKTELHFSKVILPGKPFRQANIVPKNSDYMIIDGKRYEISVTNPAPSEPLYVFQVKAI